MCWESQRQSALSAYAGDSLLFAAGAFAALGSLDVWAVSAVFIVAAILGDALNYSIGSFLGAQQPFWIRLHAAPGHMLPC